MFSYSNHPQHIHHMKPLPESNLNGTEPSGFCDCCLCFRVSESPCKKHDVRQFVTSGTQLREKPLSVTCFGRGRMPDGAWYVSLYLHIVQFYLVYTSTL